MFKTRSTYPPLQKAPLHGMVRGDVKAKTPDCGQFDAATAGVSIGAMVMALPVGKKLIGTAEAAKILGVSMGRLRQLALAGPKKGGLHSWLAAPTARVFDEAEVRKRASSGPKPGRPGGGFKAN